MSEAVDLATVELLGALTYGELRSFEVTARAVRLAPSTRLADEVATFAVREHGRYARLRDHLAARTDLLPAVLDRQKPHFDQFFDHAPLEHWVDACTFLAVGLPLAADFARAIAPRLDDESAQVVMEALADRQPFERFAIGQVASALALNPGGGVHDHVRGLVADVVGRALTGFQAGVSDTDALRVLLEQGDEPAGEAEVKQVAIQVLEAHRRRMVELGLEELD